MLAGLLREADAMDPVEKRMLRFSFGLLRLRYRLTRKLSTGMARTSLEEMAQIVHFFAGAVAQPAQVHSQ